MSHVKIVDGAAVQYPYTEKQFRADHPNTSFPKPLPDAVGQEHGRFPVRVLDQPSHNLHTQNAQQDALPSYDGTEWVLGWTVTDKPIADVKDDLTAAAAAKRYEVEFGGTTFNGSPLPTDAKTQSALTAAYVKAQADPNYTIDSWKSGPGTFSTLDAPTIIALADAIEAHVQACFTREAAIAGEIAAATTLAELAAIDINTGWP